jgi:hypothetical protein
MVASTLHCIVFLLTAWENESEYTERQTDRQGITFRFAIALLGLYGYAKTYNPCRSKPCCDPFP